MKVASETELSEAIAETSGPLGIMGGGTRRVTNTGQKLDVSRLSGITLYEPGALTLVAQAGTPLPEITATLAAEGQRLAFEPYTLRSGATTIGGIVATNASGPRRIQAGAARDFCLGVRFVDGLGRVVKNGGRVMKNVTGYDLVKLMAGSWGRLGAMTEVSLKVLPIPETTGTLVLHGLSNRHATDALTKALGSPFEVTGAAHIPELEETWLRVEGFETQVTYRLEKLKSLLSGFGDMSTSSDDIWTRLTDLSGMMTKGDLWRISVQPSRGPDVMDCLPETSTAMMDWGGGLIWAAVPEGTNLRPDLAGLGGHASLLSASPETNARIGTFEPEAPGIAALSHGIRAKFDPKGIFQGADMDAAA